MSASKQHDARPAAPGPGAGPAPDTPGGKPALTQRLRAVPGYGWYALLLVVGYGVIEIGGLGFSPGERVQVPGSVRQSPGGYRSYHFWHSGLHGGK